MRGGKWSCCISPRRFENWLAGKEMLAMEKVYEAFGPESQACWDRANRARAARERGRTRKKRLKRVCGVLIKQTLCFLAAGAVSYGVARWALQAAYAERGYEAYGGEALLIAAAFVAVYFGALRVPRKRPKAKANRPGNTKERS
jgi:hypothetical protein